MTEGPHGPDDPGRGGRAGDIRELSTGETLVAHEAMCVLRPDYADAGRFVDFVDEVLRAGGYRLVGVFAPGREQAVAAAGFRVLDSLALGHHLVIDDLSTLPEQRRAGHARTLLEWLADVAIASGCGQIHLDSVVGPSRFDAHRFYHSQGFSIYAHHFTREL